MKLSIIIPVYNEKETVLKLLERVRAVPIDKEIIIVDDGSDDATREILKKIAADGGVKVIFHERNMGKGSAIRTGLKEVTGDIVLVQDADMEYDPADYPKLIEPIISGKAMVVYGSRILGKAPTRSLIFHYGVKFLSFLTNVLYKSNISDEATCYKVFHISALKSIELKCRRFEFCPEVTAKILKNGHKIYEVPVSYYPRTYREGKKINWKDGLAAIWTLIKYRIFD
ncbi:MAG: glycosyltransferase family 2 protein [Elusimicrobia bacterium]|nr:glycosyltransferase family 2 protein [Elusimicrobiota bacterium]